MFVQIEETCSCYFFRLGLRSCVIDQNRDSLYRAYSTPFGVYIPNTMESCKGAHTGDPDPSSPPSPHYYTTNKQSNSKVSRPYYTSTPSGYPGPRPRCYYSSTPSFLNPITTLSASGEAPLADAAMSVEDPSQRKGRRIVAAGYHSRGVTWIVRSTVEDLYRSPTQHHNYLS